MRTGRQRVPLHVRGSRRTAVARVDTSRGGTVRTRATKGWSALVAATVLATGLIGVGGSPAGAAGSRTAGAAAAETATSPSQTAPAVRTLVTGLAVPWGIDFLPDGHALVTERDTARLLDVSPAGQVTVVGTVTGVQPGGEGGLLGLAVSPTFPTDRLVY